MRFAAFQFAIVMGLMLPASRIWASTPISASMEISATAEIFSVSVDGDIDTDQWGPLLSPLAVSASAVALKAPNEPGISVGGSGTATWDSADKGSVVFTDFGWTYNNTSGAAYLSYSNQSWKYKFTATEDGIFRMHANIVGEGSDLFGLNGFNFGLYGGPESNQPAYDVLDAYDPNKVWDFSGHVTSGATYTALLESQANISAGSTLSITALMDAQFDWQILPIPEPATVTLALLLAIAATGIRCRV
jgi:hypothetical protein